MVSEAESPNCSRDLKVIAGSSGNASGFKQPANNRLARASPDPTFIAVPQALSIVPKLGLIHVPASSHPYRELLDRPFHIKGPGDFNALTLDLFRLHAAKNPVYRGFLEGLGRDPATVKHVEDIPFLPIGLFRNHRVLLDGLEPAITFTSSGTTGATTSSHHVPWPELYRRSFMTSFGAVYGAPTEWRILALLPAYLEREGSSLVYMAQWL